MRKKIFAILLVSVLLIAALVGCTSIDKIQISTGDNVELKTLVLSDIRFDGTPADEVRKKMIKSMVDEKKPEFIAIGGNVVNGSNNGKLMKMAAQFFDSFEIPWATSIGELDVRGSTSKKGIINILTDKNLKYSMVMRGENWNYNYVLEIVDTKSKVISLVYFVDTSVKCSEDFVEWYKNTVKGLSFKYLDRKGNMLRNHVILNRPLELYESETNKNRDYEVHPWENSSLFENLIFDKNLLKDSTKSVMAGFDNLADGEWFEKNGVRFSYIVSMAFDSSMSGTAYDKQKNKTGGSVFIIRDSDYISVDKTWRNPEKYK